MKSILYLGLDVPETLALESVIHYPMIQIVPRSKGELDNAFVTFKEYSHVIFTSKSAVSIFFDSISLFGLSIEDKCLIAVGQKTAEMIRFHGAAPWRIAANETAEGILEILESQDLSRAYLFWPHSALSRPVISDWLQKNKIRHRSAIFYDTILQAPLPLPDLASCDEIVFTSPSTVDAFLAAFQKIPSDKILTCIGPVTQKHLAQILEERSQG